MATHRNVPDRDADMRAAAQAAASWAHARRATWTNAPLPKIEAVTIEPPAPLPPPIELEAPPRPSEPPGPSVFAEAARSAAALAAPIGRWLAVAAVIGGAGAAVVIGGRRLWTAASTTIASRTSREATTPSSSSDGRGDVPAAPKTGTLHITSSPAGARVTVDGKLRGPTPLSIADVTPGRHDVAIESEAGSVRRTVTIVAGQTAELNESIFSGWAVVYAPFEFVVSEGGRVLAPDERNEIMLAPGTHQLRITNRALSFDTVQRVEVKPGEATNVRLTPPPSSLTVTASEPAEVWVDGSRFGDTPLNNAPVQLGTHQLLVKRVAGGERRFTIVVGVKPYVLAVDFQQ